MKLTQSLDVDMSLCLIQLHNAPGILERLPKNEAKELFVGILQTLKNQSNEVIKSVKATDRQSITLGCQALSKKQGIEIDPLLIEKVQNLYRVK